MKYFKVSFTCYRYCPNRQIDVVSFALYSAKISENKRDELKELFLQSSTGNSKDFFLATEL
jgi:hypothetical protein